MIDWQDILKLIDARIAPPVPLDEAIEAIENLREELDERLAAMAEDRKFFTEEP